MIGKHYEVISGYGPIDSEYLFQVGVCIEIRAASETSNDGLMLQFAGLPNRMFSRYQLNEVECHA